jgi:6-phosphogluconolactonase (cycloisomerase 2 family)
MAITKGTAAVTYTPKFAYVTNNASFDVSAYTIDATTGALTPIQSFQAEIQPRSVAVDPSGRFAYVTNLGGPLGSNISAYTVSATTGALTQIVCPPVAGCTGDNFAAGAGATSVTVDPTGRFAFVANSIAGPGGNSVATHPIAADGTLTQTAFVNSAVGASPRSVTVDPTGRFAYAANFGTDNVSAYTINALTGALTSVGAAVAAGDGSNSVTVDPTGKFAYVANLGSDDVSAYTIHATTGALTQIPCVGGAGAGCNGNNFMAGDGPASVTVDPSGKFAYVANNSNLAGGSSVSAYTIHATTGALTSVGPAVAAGTNPRSVTVDPSGKFAYVANFSNGLAGNVSAYTINSTTGALTSIGTVAAGAAPFFVTTTGTIQ